MTPAKKRRLSLGKSASALGWPFANLDARVRLRLGVAALVVVGGFTAFAACGGCRTPKAESASASEASAAAKTSGALADADTSANAAAARASSLLWTSAKDGDTEDFATLAAHEGASGLVDAASDPALRPTAIRAMAFASGYAQLPFLAKTAGGKDDEEGRLALDATLEIAARPRRSEDPEDADELHDGCDLLGTLARDTTRPRPRRVAAIRALRMLPCPPAKSDLPTDLDAK